MFNPSFRKGMSVTPQVFSNITQDKMAAPNNAYYVLTQAHAGLPNSVLFDTAFGLKDTDDLAEGSSNLYYTDARVKTYADTLYLPIIANANVNLGSYNLTTTGTITGELIDDTLTAGRMIFAGTSGNLSDTSKLAYSTTTNTLTMNTGQINVTGTAGISGVTPTAAPDVLVITGGAGGNTETGGSDAEAGANISLTCGAGGAYITGDGNMGGSGGNFTLTTGNGGAGRIESGEGGWVTLTAGNGGDTSAGGNAGAGGSITFTAGAAGAAGVSDGIFIFSMAGADKDILCRFTGTTNIGYLYWMEDEDYFKFADDIYLPATEYFYGKHKSSDGSAGITATITTAKLTAGGADGSMTFKDGILTAQTQAT